jgi:DNA polymerase (family X)
MDNRTIAQLLMRQARYLVDRKASLYRVRAYRQAAETVLGLDEPLESIFAQRGQRGLRELPGIGAHIARTLETLVHTGALPTLIEDTHASPKASAAGPGDSEKAGHAKRAAHSRNDPLQPHAVRPAVRAVQRRPRVA